MDIVRNKSVIGRPPRAAVLQQWVPQGNGCASLRKHHGSLPDVGVLSCAFCSRYAGRTVLFVGDSVQGELFLAFASILGVISFLIMLSFMMPVKFEWAMVRLGTAQTAEYCGLLAPKNGTEQGWTRTILASGTQSVKRFLGSGGRRL